MADTQVVLPLLDQGLTIGAGGAALVALAFYVRRVFKGMGLEDAQRAVATTAAEAKDSVLQNLQAEVERLSRRVGSLEQQVQHLNEKLSTVRLLALECYELALSCTCEFDHRDQMLEHLRKIIKDG